MTHLRKGSKLLFYIDVEKVEDPEQKPKHKRDVAGVILLVVLMVLLVGTVVNLYLIRTPDNKTLLEELWSSWRIDERATHADYTMFDTLRETEELWKMHDRNQQYEHEQQMLDDRLRGKTQDEEDVEVDPKKDLSEILLISPITILVNNGLEVGANQSRFLEILLSAFTITPEPKVVNLIKHPHYQDLVEYLQSIDGQGHSDDDFSLNDEDDDIPRLFIGGAPMGGYDDIIAMYEDGELMDFLIENGRGLISIV